jgi:hypothetical protein
VAAGKTSAVIYDYVDAAPMFWAQWGKRGRLYRQLGMAVRTVERAA